MLNITLEAEQHLQKYLPKNNFVFEFTTDKVGCTCSEESIISLAINKEPSKEATEIIESNIGPFYVTKKQKLLLNDDLTLDFKKNLFALELRGAHLGLINPRVNVKVNK